MPDSGMVDTSIYKNQNYDPFSFQNKLLENQQKQQAVEEGQLRLAMERFQTINSAAAGLLSDPDLGKTDIKGKLWDTLARATASDAMTAQHAVEFATKFPTDPNRQRQAILDVHGQTLDALQRGQAYLGQTQGYNTGSGTKFFNVPAFGNRAPQDLGYQPSGVAPGTPQYGPDNRQTFTGGSGNQPFEPPANNLLQPPVQSQQPQLNRLGVAPPPNLMPPTNGAPARRVVPSSPKVVGDLEAIRSGMYEKPATFAQRFQPPGSIVAAPPPGAVEAQAAQAGESQKVGSALNARADLVPHRIADLNNMERELEIAGGKFGPLAHSEKKANQISQRVLGFGVTMSPEEVAGIENFDKIGNQIALNQAGALGVTDQRVQTSMGANPNSNYSYLGNKGILPILKGNEDAIALKAREWKKYSKANGAASYNDFSDEFNKDFNPQVFQFARMTPEQRSKFVAAIPDKEQAVRLCKRP